MGIADKVAMKGADPSTIAAEAIENPAFIEELIAGVTAPTGTLRYGFEKVLRAISEQRPDLVYPFFDRFVQLMDGKNSFLKWGAILTIANLTPADTEGRFERIFRKYYAPITGPAMVTAANIVGSSVKIISAKPMLTQRITRAILRVEKADFERHGEPSAECRNVVLGHAIDALDQVFDRFDDKATVVRFVKRQLNNTRRPVVRKAEAFLAKHA